MFGLWFTLVCVLSILLGSLTGGITMLIWDKICDNVIMGVALDNMVAILFAIIALTAELGIPAAAIILATC